MCGDLQLQMRHLLLSTYNSRYSSGTKTVANVRGDGQSVPWSTCVSMREGQFPLAQDGGINTTKVSTGLLLSLVPSVLLPPNFQHFPSCPTSLMCSISIARERKTMSDEAVSAGTWRPFNFLYCWVFSKRYVYPL